jgi:hypothetical protein
MTSESCASQHVSCVSIRRQIDSIFIYYMNKQRYQYLINEYGKFISIYVDLNISCSSIGKQIDLFNKEFQAFQFFDQHQNFLNSL